MVKQRKPNPELIDEKNPEWTAADFRHAKPAVQVLPKLFDKRIAAEMLQPNRGRGRPASKNPKAHVNIRLDADVIEAFRASGDGWQTRLNSILKDWLKSHSPV